MTEEQYAQRCERATEKHNIFLPVNKQLAGRELSKFFVEQMPMAMTQRGQMLYEEELHAAGDIFDDPDAVFQRCCAMMRHAYDPMGEKPVLGVFSVVGAAGSYVLPRSTPPAPATAAHDSRGRKSTASKKREESERRDGRPSTRGGDPRKLEMRTDGSGAGRTRVFTDPKQRCKAGTCRYDHADRPCYADPRERIELSFEMRPAAYKRILAQREDNAKWLRCKVEPFIQGAPRPAALAVSEDGLDPSGVGMTSWAFFANEGAPRDYVQARPGTGVDDTEPEPESDLDRRAESDSSSGSDSENFTFDAKSHQGQSHGAWLWPTQVAFKAAAVAPVEHPAFTTAAAPTSPMDLADGAAQAVSAQAAAEPPLLAIKEGCGLGDQNAADGQHVQPVSAGDASQATPAQAAQAQAALAQAPPSPAIKEGCGLGLGAPDPDISGSVRQHAQAIGVDPESRARPRPSMISPSSCWPPYSSSASQPSSTGPWAARASSPPQAEASMQSRRASGELSSSRNRWRWGSHWPSGTSRAYLDTLRYPCGRW